MIRTTLITLFCLLLSDIVTAQSAIRIQPRNCVDLGKTLTVSGRGFLSATADQVTLEGDGRDIKLKTTNWSERGFKARLPRRGLAQDKTYQLKIEYAGARAITLGEVKICAGRIEAGAQEKVKTAGRQPRAASDVVPTPSGAPEYAVLVPNAQVQAALNAIQSIGGNEVRRRSLGQLGHVLLLVELAGGGNLQDLQNALNTAAPNATADFHHIYGFANAPRLYAATLVGATVQGCSVPTGTRIGIVDGGVNANHPALNGVAVKRHKALSAGEKQIDRDHGTAVAALIAGRSQNLAGFAKGATVYAAEAFGRSKSRSGARLENIADSLNWMIANGVAYINLSMSGAPNRSFERLLNITASKGVLLVAAAGNEGSSKPRYPAASGFTVAATAVDASGKAFRKANTGNHISIAAPGVDIFVASSSGASYKSGTSYAAPIVTARLAAARIRSARAATAFFQNNSSDLGATGKDNTFGFGLIKFKSCQ